MVELQILVKREFMLVGDDVHADKIVQAVDTEELYRNDSEPNNNFTSLSTETAEEKTTYLFGRPEFWEKLPFVSMFSIL